MLIKIREHLFPVEKIKILVHSIAKGSLKPMVGDTDFLNGTDFSITFEAMALSLYEWVNGLYTEGLFASDARIIAYTSAGSYKAWAGYAAVSAAKAALEAIVRSIALEFGPLGLRANCIEAGTTDTKALRMIPDHKTLLSQAREKNPLGRLTTSNDIADVAYLLSLPEARWINGSVLKVDGGESLR